MPETAEVRARIDHYKRVILGTFEGTDNFTGREIQEIIGVPEDEIEIFEKALTEVVLEHKFYVYHP